MGFGRGATDAYRTNAVLIKEGLRTYSTQSDERKTVEAFTDAGLTAERRGAQPGGGCISERGSARGQAIAAAQTDLAEVGRAVAESQKHGAGPGSARRRSQSQTGLRRLEGQGHGNLALYGIPAG